MKKPKSVHVSARLTANASATLTELQARTDMSQGQLLSLAMDLAMGCMTGHETDAIDRWKTVVIRSEKLRELADQEKRKRKRIMERYPTPQSSTLDKPTSPNYKHSQPDRSSP